MSNVTCKTCNFTPLNFCFCHDDGAGGDYAYNLYACEKCGTIMKQDVWGNSGWTIITTSGAIERVDQW